MSIIDMGVAELGELKAEDVKRSLTPEEVVHIAKLLGALWTYDYEAADQGKVGMHALLKSGLHSDGFFVSRILLAPENVRRLISAQMAMRIRAALAGRDMPSCVAGVPDGATKLGEDIGEILGVRVLEMQKADGEISLSSPVGPEEPILLIEDFCTRGTGFTEAVRVIRASQPGAKFVPYDPVIINRGGLKNVSVEGVGEFKVLPIVEWRVQD